MPYERLTICFSFLLGMTAVPREIENNAPNQKNAASIRGDATATIPWVPEVLSRVRRGASFRRPQAEDTSGVWPKPETAHEKPLAPRVLQQERRLKSEFAFFQSLWRLFLPTYFVNCRRTVLKQNFKGPYLILEREIKFCRCLVTFFIKREIRHFHVVVVQKRERNIQKSVMHVQSCCFAYQTYCFYGVLVAVRVVGS